MPEAPMTQPSDTRNPFEVLRDLAQTMEIGLLGAALTNPAVLDAASPYVDQSDFSHEFLAIIWQSMVDLHAAGTRVSPNLIATRISSPEHVQIIAEKHGGRTPFAFLAWLAAEGTEPVNGPDYAKTVREMRHRRDLHIAGERLMAGAYDPTQPMREVAGACSSAIEVALNHGEEPKRSVQDLITESVGMLETGHMAPGYTTGLTELDRLTGGFVPTDLVVIGARPSMGKSTLGLSSALQSAWASHKVMRAGDGEPWGVLIMTHEMTHLQVTQRNLCDLSFSLGDSAHPLEYTRFRPAPGVRALPISATQRAGLDQARALLPRLPLVVDGRPGMTIAEVTATVRMHQKKFRARGIPLKVVIFDHIGLGKIVAVKARNNPVLELGEITTSLKGLAVNEDLCSVACHQLSRANEGRENRRPSLADFRDSGHIEQDADVMLGLYRHAYYLGRTKEGDTGKDEIRVQQLKEQEHDMEAFVLKNRQGPIGLANLWAHMPSNSVRNKALEAEARSYDSNWGE